MRAAVLGGDGIVRVDEVPVPQPRPGEVRFRVEGCGVCGSDLPVWEGREWFSYPWAPGAPGHEPWGFVEDLGEGVTDLELGDRIAALSYHGYAEFDVAQSDRVIRLPSGLSGVAFPGEALGCAYNVFRRAQISAQDTVAVVGIGFIGAAVAQLAAGAGARVIGISRSESSRRTARAVGCEEALELGDAAIERVQGLTDDRLCDVVVEAAGVQATLDLAAALTRLRGRLVIAGYHQDGPRQVDMQMWNWRGLDVINAHERDPQIYREGMRLAADAVREQRLRLETLVTHSFPLEQLSEAMAAVAGGDRAIVKAVVCP